MGGGGAIREGYRFQTWSKNPIMAPFSVYLSPDMSADASADALAIINIRTITWTVNLPKGSQLKF